MFQSTLITDSNGNIFDTATGKLAQAGTGPICIGIDGLGNYYDTISMKPLAVIPYNRWSAFIDGQEGQILAFMSIIIAALVVIWLLITITKMVK